MTAMTDARLAEIEARAAKATPGPWKSEYYHEVWDDDFAVEHNLENPEEGVSGYWLTGLDMLNDGDGTMLLQVQDADFIAAARSDIPDLLAEIARLRADLAARDATIAGLREALTFYARAGNYYRPSQMAGETSHSAMENDCGDKARAALATSNDAIHADRAGE